MSSEDANSRLAHLVEASDVRSRWAGRASWRAVGTTALAILSLPTFLILWELAVRERLVSPLFLPAPTTIGHTAVDLIRDGTLVDDVLTSTRRVLVGFGLSIAAAIPVGVVIGRVPMVAAALNPLLSLIRPLPSLSWIPLAMLWLGIGETEKYAIVFMGVFAAGVVYVVEATKHVDPVLVTAGRNLGANRLQVLWHVVLPAALPQIFGGCKVVLALAWTCIISAEMVGASSGLGYLIWNGKSWNNTPQILAGMAGISATVLVIDWVFRRIERRIFPWREVRE